LHSMRGIGGPPSANRKKNHARTSGASALQSEPILTFSLPSVAAGQGFSREPPMPARLAQLEDENINPQMSGSEREFPAWFPSLGKERPSVPGRTGVVRCWQGGTVAPPRPAGTPSHRRRGTWPRLSTITEQGFSEEQCNLFTFSRVIQSGILLIKKLGQWIWQHMKIQFLVRSR
jgi:hypothetical protein